MTATTGVSKAAGPLSSDAVVRDSSQIEHYGVHCQEPTCNLSDFLPFKCGYCRQSYCSSHRLPFAHSCSAYDASAADVRASLCQWCEQPLRVENLQGRDTDINTAMEYHISSGECPVLKDVGPGGLFKDDPAKGQQPVKKKPSNQCKHWKCKNIMWVDIKCPSCGQGFCPSHREPRAHKCGEEQPNGKSGSGLSRTAGGSSSSAKMASGPLDTSFAKSGVPSPKLSSKGPGMFSKLSSQTASPSTTGPFAKLSLKSSKEQEQAPSTSSKPNIVNAIKGKTTSNVNDMSASRRAAREREQAALALQNRAKKGLLTEDEKVKYATLQAMQAKSNDSGKNKDCLIS